WPRPARNSAQSGSAARMRRPGKPRRTRPAMGTTMANPACEWVRARLPLWVGDGDGPTEPGDEGGDLSIEDRRSIDRHLDACPTCREHRIALEQALGALARAAAMLSVPPDTPSLWPTLEPRIEAHDARSDARWSPAV